MGSRKHGGSDPSMERTFLWGKGRPILKYRDALPMQNGWTALNDLYVYDVFPRKDVVYNAAHLPQPSTLWGVNKYFQAKLADCGCLPFAGRLLFADCG